MFATIALVALLGSALFLANQLLAVLRSWQAAKRSNLPYHFVLIHSFHLVNEMTRVLWERPLEHLPASWRSMRWYKMKETDKLWKLCYNMFRMYGSDSFLTITPTGKSEFFTADPAVISQIVARKNDFPKPLWVYKVLDVYGKNVVTTEGAMWRRHRKVVGPPFTEKNNGLVWSEAIYHTQAMIKSMLKGATDSTPTVPDLDPYISYLALGVISMAGYGVRLGWQDESGKMVYDETTDEKDGGVDDGALGRDWLEGRTHGHTLPFGECLHLLAKDLLWIIVVPQWLLSRLPLAGAREAYAAYRNWDGYMREMLAAKRKMLSDSKQQLSHDLLSTLVRNMGKNTSLYDRKPKPAATNGGGKEEDEDEEAGVDGSQLSDEEILGNTFALMVAGHETTAGSLTHAMLMLAVDVETQRKLQADIDAIVGDDASDPSEWDYERYFPRLFAGMPGAVLAEQLRLLTVAHAPPKWSPRAQTLTVDGRQCTIPAGTEICMDLPAVQRNPRYWKHGPRDPRKLEYCGAHAQDPDTDLGEFRPERWLPADYKPGGGAARSDGDGQANGRANGHANGHANGNGQAAGGKKPADADGAEADGLAINTAEDNAAGFLKPPRGAYLPFSEGFRSCMGRRFAQVEAMAMLAALFRTWSVELAVDNWATDAQVAAMDRRQRADVWAKARHEVHRAFTHDVELLITAKVRSDMPVRLVKRGHERFTDVTG